MISESYGSVPDRDSGGSGNCKLRRQDVRFSRTQVCQATALSDTQARIHLERLIAMDYVLVHRGTRG